MTRPQRSAESRPVEPKASSVFLATARKAFAALTPDRKAKIADGIKMALTAHGPSVLSAILISCQTSLKHTDRVQDWVTGEAVQGCLYALAVHGRVTFEFADGGDLWSWRKQQAPGLGGGS